jgi:PKD repeat protein
MRKEKSLCWLFMIVIVTTVFMNIVTVSSPSSTIVLVEPSISGAVPGKTFTVDVEIENVDNLYSYQVNMSFDPNILEYVNVTEGDILKEQPEGTITVPPLVEDGWVLFFWSTKSQYSGVDGSGTLATVEFKALEWGESYININNTFVLENSHPYEDQLLTGTKLIEMAFIGAGQVPKNIPFTPVNGFFTNLDFPPVADFTYSPNRPKINETVTFNASTSYDQNGTIVSYEWDFGDGTTGTGEIATHQYLESGVHQVDLTVTDNTANNDTYTSNVEVKYTNDIKLTNVKLSTKEVTAGETVTINATALNRGAVTKNFTITAYYDDTIIDEKTVTNLDPDAEVTKTFSWDTAGVAEGVYQISAKATEVEGEEAPNDNEFVDGTVHVKASGSQDLGILTIFAIVVVVAGVLGAGVFLYLRRRNASPPS